MVGEVQASVYPSSQCGFYVSRTPRETTQQLLGKTNNPQELDVIDMFFTTCTIFNPRLLQLLKVRPILISHPSL